MGLMRVWWLAVVRVAVFVLGVVGVLLVFVGSALAGPAWRVTAEAVPSVVAPGGKGSLLLHVTDVGDAPSVAGLPVKVVDQVPQGFVAVKAGTLSSQELSFEGSGRWGECEISAGGRTVTCTYQAGGTIAPFRSIGEIFNGVVPSSLAPMIGIEVKSVDLFASGSFSDTATVFGGGAPGEASATAGVGVGFSAAPFGVAGFDQWSVNADSTPATQAGSHPYETTTSLTFNNELDNNGKGVAPTGGVVRDINVELPSGFVGNPNAVPKCPRPEFDLHQTRRNHNPVCPSDTQVGVATVYILPNLYAELPVYDLVPPAGVPAQFGFGYERFVGLLNAGVRPGPDGSYSVVVDGHDFQPTEEVSGATVSFWGDPAEPSHDALRFPSGTNEVSAGNSVSSGVVPRPFLSLGSSCGVPQTLGVSVVSWEDPLQSVVPFTGLAASTDEQENPVVLDGCSKLDFSPSVEARTGTGVAESPTGLQVGLKVPQNEDPNGLSEADLKDVSVTLPAGMSVSPSAANGLESCSEGQFGVSGSGSSLLFNESPVVCPAASKLGTVEVTTPLLEHPLQGALYLAQQEANPFGSLVALYLAVEGSGVLVKRAGEVRLNQQTGQITVSFLNNPQVPLSEIKVDTFQSSKSSVMTPSGCGTYSTTTSLTGWNGSFATPEGSFPVSSGCAQNFKPSFVAETTSNGAGVFSPFVVAVSRGDGEQRFGGVSMQTPPGVSGVLKGVQRCPEPQASNGTCGLESQIGHATIAVGPGPEPFYAPANVFLTGPYGGAPFGLSIVARAKAGPFDLGNVIVRARISVDPHTAQITVTTDPSGPYRIPTVLKGIPLDLRLANVAIDRPNFIFNPTNCSPLTANSVMVSATGTSYGTSSPFQATGCSKLPFKPGFSASTQATTSKADGASLTVKISEAPGFPGEANIRRADVQLPIALPARLTTLQKACTEAQFNANPAGCPPASVIGTAKAITPLLGVPLSGPALLVSHGGAAFPDVEFVLQGEGITIVLDGATQIKKGITYSKFETVPDAPINSFETKLPEGPYSVLATNIPAKAKGSLCAVALNMPTILEGQNRAQLTQTTKITITGCPKTKAKPKLTQKTKDKSTKSKGKTARQTTGGTR